MTDLHPSSPSVSTAPHVPVRTCVGCKQAVPQGELLRVVLVGGRVIADPGRREPGRGAWVHRARECLAAAAKGGFARSFRASVGRPDLEAMLGTSTNSGQGGGNAVESVPVPVPVAGATD